MGPEQGQGAPRSLDIETHRATQGQIGRDAAEHDIGVGDRGHHATASVCGRAGIGTGRCRSHPQRTSVVNPRKTPATGANGPHRDRGDTIHPSRPTVTRRVGRMAVDAADVGGGATHVEADDRPMALGPAQGRGGHDAGGRTRKDHASGVGRRHGEGEQATRGCHHQTPSALERAVETGQVAGQLRRQIGVEDGGSDPLVLPELG